ncbi:unnamed protein product [Mytilus coruscus]|uniref:Uncharacterized protein n=1 Tax=Mytilus coruscus TaxID=42192 RepID=A0A6J8AX74_MYTCO|nr:unnamed protein product [Mytilus coruscus]
MFLGTINQSNSKIVLGVLESIKYGGIDRMLMNLFPPHNENGLLSMDKSEYSCIMFDFLFYKIAYLLPVHVDIPRCYKYLIITENLLMSESSSFIVSVCKFNYAKISQMVAQLLPPLTLTSKTYNIRSCYHRHLQNGTQYDAVSGWLLYASYYYVTGQFNVTLRLTDYILSRCSPDMIRDDDYDCKKHINCYRQKCILQ